MKFIEDFLWRASVEGGAALLVVFLICRVATGIPAHVKCWLWRLAWLRVVLAVFSWRLIEAPLLPPEEIPKVAFVEMEKSSAPSGVQEKTGSEPVVALAGSLNHRLPSWKPSGLQLIVSVWVFGVVLAMARIGFQFNAARRSRRSSSITRELDAELESACEEIGVAKPALLISRSSEKPVLVGIFRPAIILPATLIESERTRLGLIFRHELAHLKRRDLIWNWLTAVGGALLWFHPLAWLGVRETNLAQEMACDEMTLEKDRAKIPELANLLIDLASGKDAGSPASISAVGIIQTKKSLERRIKAMKIQRRSGWWMVLAFLVAAPAVVPWRVVAQKAEDAKAKPEESQPLVKAISPQEKALLERDFKLAEEDANNIWGSVGKTAERTEALEKSRELARIGRKLAFAKKDLTGVKKYLKDEIMFTHQLRDEVANHIALGLAAPEAKDKYVAELKELQKQMIKYGPDLSGTPTRIPIMRDGTVTSVNAPRGARVKKTTPIVRLNDDEARIKVEMARSELEIAEADYKLQEIDIENQLAYLKEKRALSIEDNSLKQRSDLKLTKARAVLAIARQKLEQAVLELDAFTVKAPRDGVVANTPSIGERIGPGVGRSVEYFPDEE